MGEALRTHRAALHLLDVIVANSGRCLQPSSDIGIVNNLALLATMRPHTGKAVGLQLKIDGELILLPGILTGEVLHLLLNPENVLHMVA